MNVSHLKVQLKEIEEKKRRIMDQVVLMQKKVEMLDIKSEQLKREISEDERD